MDYYDNIAPGYDELHENEQLAKLYKLLEHVPLKGKVLDVGAGTCIVARYVKRVTCVSIDPSEEMLAKGVGERHVASAEELPFSDDTFDAVVSLTALHHSDLDKALPEIYRVVKVGGTVAISFLKKSSQVVIFEKLFRKLFSSVTKVDAHQDLLFISVKHSK